MFDNILYYKVIESPVGALRLVAADRGLCALMFETGGRYEVCHNGSMQQASNHPVLQKAERQLDDYFAAKRQSFDLPLDMRGTIFQIKAWKELQKIPYGSTISYGEQAKRVGDPKKARAVGMANGRNPLAIIVPCHRVIGASGSLTGFAGGLKTKEFLLNLEQKQLRKVL